MDLLIPTKKAKSVNKLGQVGKKQMNARQTAMETIVESESEEVNIQQSLNSNQTKKGMTKTKPASKALLSSFEKTIVLNEHETDHNPSSPPPMKVINVHDKVDESPSVELSVNSWTGNKRLPL